MISSGALPNVALRKPPIPGPVCSAACSVASPISHASGISAADARTNSTVAVEVGEIVEEHHDRREGEEREEGATDHGRVPYRAVAHCLKFDRMSSLAERCGTTHNSGVEQPVQAPTELPLRPQDEVECRRCEVHCDKVVYPGACIERSCPFVYAYEAWGHTYVGCMQRVYGVEIDLDLLRAAEARQEGFGGIRATGAPLPMCKVEVAACYESRTRRARLPESRVPRGPARAPELPRDRQITPR